MVKKLIKLLLFIQCGLAFTTYAQQPQLMLPLGHTGGINSLEISPDDKLILTASDDRTAKVWDAESGKLVFELKGHSDAVKSAHFSPDGKTIVTASMDASIKIWNAHTGRFIADLPGVEHYINVAMYSPDGKKIAASSLYDYSIYIWDVATLKLAGKITDVPWSWKINQECFSPDSKMIITPVLKSNALKVSSTTDASLVAVLNGHRNTPTSASFSHDSKRIITTSWDSTARIWNAGDGKPLHEFTGLNAIGTHAVFSSDNKLAITASKNNQVKIWNAITGSFIRDLPLTSGCSMLVIAPGGKNIATVSSDSSTRIWDLKTGKLLRSFRQETWVEAAKFSKDGTKIMTIPYDGISKLWDVATGNYLAPLSRQRYSNCYPMFSNNSKYIAGIQYYTVPVTWDAGGKLLNELKGHNAGINNLLFSKDRKKLAFRQGNTIKIHHAETQQPIQVLTQMKGLHNWDMSPDGTMILTNIDTTLKIMDVASGSVLFEIEENTARVRQAVFSPDSRKLATFTYWDDFVKIWDLETGRLFSEIKNIDDDVSSAVFSADAKKLLVYSSENWIEIFDVEKGILSAKLEGYTASDEDDRYYFNADGLNILVCTDYNEAAVWDQQTGRKITDLKGSCQWIKNSAFSADGKKLVTSSQNNDIQVWEISTGKMLYSTKWLPDKITTLMFSKDGNRILGASADGIARTWDASNGNILKEYKGHSNSLTSATYTSDDKSIYTASYDNTFRIWEATTARLKYTYVGVDSADHLVVDEHNRYDGTAAARKLLYFTCGTEIVELDQVKDQLWVPDLMGRIHKEEPINARTLKDLDICGLTPKVEEERGVPGSYSFSIKPGRGGLGETIVYINGMEAKRYQPQQLKKISTAYQLSFRKEELANYFISGSENLIAVKSFTRDNTIASRGLRVPENKSKEPVVIPNFYGVMVGVSDYKGGDLDLKYAAKDAMDMSNALGLAARKLLNTDGKEHVFMYDLTTSENRYQLPEKNSIKKLLEEIGKKATPNDILLIFFAGHGVMETKAEKAGGKKQFYFLTADASSASSLNAVADVGISTYELTEWIKPDRIRAQKRILILDACNSGQAISDFVKMGKDGQGYKASRNDEKSQQVKAIESLNERSGLFILAAAASDQNAYELGRYSQGLLTYALLKAIKQQPDILDQGKYLDLSRWFNAAERTVSDLTRENGARQQPQLVTSSNFNIGMVDEDVLSKIILPQEKPLFAASNFQNSNDSIGDDDLDLSGLINNELNNISKRGNAGTISYVTYTNSPDTYNLTGRYEVNGNAIVVKVNLKQGKLIKQKFEVSGTKDNLPALAGLISDKAAGLVK